jgi:hypothetical protein
VLLNEFAGTKFKLVAGYRGAADMNVAMERGEAHARISSWSGLKSQQGAWISDRKVAMIAQGGAKRQSDLPAVPLYSELIKDPEGLRLLALIESGAVVGWPLLLPPGVPAERLAAWRKAFEATMKDPGFIAEVSKAKLDVDPKTGTEIEKAMTQALAVDDKLLARAPYERTREALLKLSRLGPIDPAHGIKLRYANPASGGYPFPTIAVFIQWLPAGFAGSAYRATDGTVMCCVEGTGSIAFGDRVFQFEKGDVWCCPPWVTYRLSTSSEAIVFSYSDRAAQEALGFWREETLGGNR